MRLVGLSVWMGVGLAYGYQAPPQAAPATASVEGQVFNAATGAPLKKATVSLNSMSAPARGAMLARFSKETDEQGRFSFAALDPGRYQLAVNRTGFLRQSYGARKYSGGGTPLVLSADQRVRNVVFKLSPQSVITGKILDEDGDPVPNIQVRAMKYQYQGGKKTWVQVGGGQTSDIGEYRIPNLDPGKYVVSTTSRNPGGGPMQTISNEELPAMPELAYAATYYPSTMDATTAVPVDLTAGAELRGIDVRLRKAPVFRIRGKVAGAPNGRIMVALSPKEGNFEMRGMTQAMPPDFRFEMRGVSTGSYVLHAQSGNGPQQIVAFQEVRIGNQHLDGVVLSVAAGSDVQGAVKIEDANAPIPMPNLSVFVRPSLPIGNAPRAKVTEDLKFTIKNVVPLHYMVNVSGVPESCFVKSIRYGGQPIPEDGVDILGGGAIEVVLSATAGEIAGAVVDKDGKPVAGALVTLITKDKPPTEARTTDEKGAVTFKGLKPGDYRLVAWEDIPRGIYQDPEFLKLYESRGETVKLEPSAHQAVQLKVIPVEETDK